MEPQQPLLDDDSLSARGTRPRTPITPLAIQPGQLGGGCSRRAQARGDRLRWARGTHRHAARRNGGPPAVAERCLLSRSRRGHESDSRTELDRDGYPRRLPAGWLARSARGRHALHPAGGNDRPGAWLGLRPVWDDTGRGITALRHQAGRHRRRRSGPVGTRAYRAHRAPCCSGSALPRPHSIWLASTSW